MSELIVKKFDRKQQIVYGEVYVPNIPDTDGEFMTAETIQEAAHRFMKKGITSKVDVNHDNKSYDGVHVVESWIVTHPTREFPNVGAWAIGVHIENPELWNKVEKKELNSFSLQAKINRKPVEVELDSSIALKGVTDEEVDHFHTFEAQYDTEGNFVSGKTSVDKGHYHDVRKGTITEIPTYVDPSYVIDGDTHYHRYAALDIGGKLYDA